MVLFVPILGTLQNYSIIFLFWEHFLKKTITTREYGVFLHWLKQQRLNQGLTMRDVAKQINKPHSWIAKTESGERRLDVMEYVSYCLALKIEPQKGIKHIKEMLTK